MDLDRLKTLASSYPPPQRKAQFMEVARDGYEAELSLRDLADVFGLKSNETSVGELWAKIVDELKDHPRVAKRTKALGYVLQEGNLAERMIARVGKTPSTEDLRELVSELSDCLAKGHHFDPTNDTL